MVRAAWLRGLRRRISSATTIPESRRSRRRSLNWLPPAAEVLEVRLVLDGDPIPPPADSPIDLTTASGDATSSRSALVLAATSFTSAFSTLEGTYLGDLVTQQSDHDDDLDDAVGDFDSAVDSINSALTSDLDSLGNGFDLLVDGHEGVFEGDLDDADGDFNTNMVGPTNTLTLGLSGIDSAFETAITAANGQLDNAINGLGGFKDILEGVLGPQQSTLTSNISGHNATFAGVITSEQSSFDAAEAGFWTNYLTAVGLGPTGLEAVYNSSLSAAESTRDGVLTANSSHTYDPSVIFATAAYTALLDGANSTLNADLQDAADDYAANIAGREATFNNAINGPGGAVETFNDLMDAADDQFDSDMDDADADYDSAMVIAQGIYDAAVDALETTFETNVAAIMDIYNDAVALAQSNRDDDHANHQSDFDDAVAAADQAYSDWINGTSASGPITVVTTRTIYVDPADWKTHYSIVTVYTDANGVSTTTNSTTISSAAPAGTLASSTPGTFTTDAGLTVSAIIETYTNTITPPATNGNVFLVAMQTRLEQLEDRLEEIGESLADAIAGFQATRDAAIQTANDNYGLASGGPTGFVTVYDGAVSAAYQNVSDTMSDAQEDYQDALDLYNQSVMDAMMNGDPMPSNTPVLVATRDYQLAAAGADVLLTSDLGTALVAFVSAERGFDTIRDTEIINAINDYLEDSINEVDAKQQEAIAEVVEALHDLIDLDDGFAKADAGKQKDRVAAISDAAKQFALDENQSDETLLLAESAAWQACQKDVATEVQTFRNGEMGARVTLMQSEATAAEQWDQDATNAITSWFIAAAIAEDTYTTLMSNAQVILQNGLLADYVTYTGDTTTAFDTWVNTVSNGVATQYAGYHGGSVDATNVVNAWRDYDQDASIAWKSFVDADAAQFQSYGQTTAIASQAAILNISSANVIRAAAIAGELSSYMAIMGPALESFKQSVWGAMAPWMTSMAGAEKTAVDDSADAINAYETSLYAELRDLGDDFATAADDYVDNMLADWQPYLEAVITAGTNAAHDRTGEMDNLWNDIRIAGTTLAQDDRTSWQTFKLGTVGLDDGLMSAHAVDIKAQGVLGAVNNYTTLSATPLSNFESQIGQSATVGMSGMMLSRPNSDDDYLAWADTIPAVVNPPAPATPVVNDLRSKVEAATKQQDLWNLQRDQTRAFSAAQQAIRDVENSWPWGRAAAEQKLATAMNKLNSLNARLNAMQGGTITPQFATGSNHPGYNIGERVAGAAQLVVGTGAMAIGAAVTGVGTVATAGAPPAAPVSIPVAILGSAAMVGGFDQASAGLNRLITGQAQRSLVGRALDSATADPATSEYFAMLGTAGIAAGASMLQAATVAAATQTGLGAFAYASQYGIQPYGRLQERLSGSGLQAHHLIEQRFAALLGMNPRTMASIALTREEHQVFTNAWRDAIPYGTGTASATKEQVLDAARLIYADFPSILTALGL